LTKLQPAIQQLSFLTHPVLIVSDDALITITSRQTILTKGHIALVEFIHGPINRLELSHLYTRSRPTCRYSWPFNRICQVGNCARAPPLIRGSRDLFVSSATSRMLLKRHRRRLRCCFGREVTLTIRLLAWGFLLMFYSNHSRKVHHSLSIGQTDRRKDSSIA